MSRFLKEQYKDMEPYTPGEQPKVEGLIKLNTNENPYPPSPEVNSILDGDGIRKLVRYPDPQATELISAIAEFYGVETSQVAVGNGSDEILAFIYMAFGRKIYYPAISYGFYPVYAEMNRLPYIEVPLTNDLDICIEDYKSLHGTVFLANPNAPTGRAKSASELEEPQERHLRRSRGRRRL